MVIYICICDDNKYKDDDDDDDDDDGDNIIFKNWKIKRDYITTLLNNIHILDMYVDRCIICWSMIYNGEVCYDMQ